MSDIQSPATAWSRLYETGLSDLRKQGLIGDAAEAIVAHLVSEGISVGFRAGEIAGVSQWAAKVRHIAGHEVTTTLGDVADQLDNRAKLLTQLRIAEGRA